MTAIKDLENEICNRLLGDAWGRFPSGDIRKICPNETMELHTVLDLYLAEIAGYTVNVRQVRRKSKEQLLDMHKRLSRSFFERYQAFECYQRLIDQDSTPNLYRSLDLAEQNRRSLLRLVELAMQATAEAS